MTGKSRIAFWTITLIILFGLLMAIGYMMINEYNEEIVYHNLTPEGYDLIEQKVDLDTNLLLTKKDGKYGTGYLFQRSKDNPARSHTRKHGRSQCRSPHPRSAFPVHQNVQR